MRRSRMRSYTALVDCGAGTGRHTPGVESAPFLSPGNASHSPTPSQGLRCKVQSHPPRSRDSPGRCRGSPPGRPAWTTPSETCTHGSAQALSHQSTQRAGQAALSPSAGARTAGVGAQGASGTLTAHPAAPKPAYPTPHLPIPPLTGLCSPAEVARPDHSSHAGAPARHTHTTHWPGRPPA